MKWAWIAACCAGLLLGACDSDGGDPTASAVAGSPTAAPTAAPSIPAPDRPTSLADYPQALAAHGTESPEAAASCFPAVFAEWEMPSITAGAGCRLSNTDGDPEDEIVLALSANVVDPLTGASVPSFLVAVLDRVGDGYVTAFQSSMYPLSADDTVRGPILDAGDLNGDGRGEFAFTSQYCGQTACLDLAYILEGLASGYEPIGPRDGIGIAEGTFEFVDEDGDGAKELLATGGAIASSESGPQRPRTEVWTWDGTVYALSETRPGESQYLYHRILDADSLLQAGDYAGAEAAYVAATGDTTLIRWKPEDGEGGELAAYAQFRAALSVLLAGGDASAATAYLDQAKALAGTLHAQLAASFQAGYAAKGEVSAGCAAVRDDVRINEAEYAAFWDYGTANPLFDPRAVCPF